MPTHRDFILMSMDVAAWSNEWKQDLADPSTQPSLSAGPGDNDANAALIDERLLVEQVRLLYAQTTGGLIASAIGAGGLALVLWDMVPRAQLLPWLGLMCFVLAARVALIRLYRHAEPAPEAVKPWRAWFALAVGATGLLWGAALVMFFPGAPGLRQIYVAILVVTMSAGGLVMFAPSFFIYAMFVSGALGPFAAWIFFQGTEFIILGVFATALVTMLLVSARRVHDTLMTSLRLRFETESLASKLFWAKEEAELANRAKSDFLSRMSHELRTPLNAILGFGQLLDLELADDPRDAERGANVQQILNAGEHLLGLIDDVLELSRIDSGGLSLSLERCAPGAAIVASLSLVRGAADERGIRINDRAADRALPDIKTDLARLRQILVNLLSNAVKYNRDGGTVTLDAEPVHGNMLRISIGDTGPGIPLNKQADLFKPFDRLGAEASGIEGTGIGLTISRRLVEVLGGRLGFESAPGQGSTFWVDLPLATAHDDTPETAAGPASDGTALGRFAGRVILCVEDNPANLRLIEALVARVPGATLLTGGDAQTGLEMARSHLPDVILMDINLPGMDGFEALAALKADPATAAIPVIALTANAMPADIERGRAAGFVRYLTKPIKLDGLLDALAFVVEDRAAR
jgi:signal transduction histidine kinase/CheY-like chemotaxis protein